MDTIIMIGLGGFFLVIIIASGVKLGVKQALNEFKEDIIKEFNINKIDDDDKKQN